MEHRTSPHRSIEFYQALPKVDLHRHLEGSLRLETLVEVAQQHGIAEGRLLSHLVQVEQSEPYTIQNFLSKFETLRLFYRTPEIIRRITREAIADAAADNVRYLELRFTPAALCKAQRLFTGGGDRLGNRRHAAGANDRWPTHSTDHQHQPA